MSPAYFKKEKQMKLEEELFNKWRAWTGKISNDLMELLSNRQIYNHFIGIAENNLEHINKNQGQIFIEFVTDCYAISTAVGIRRHLDMRNDSISLMRLIKQIKEYAQQFTYDIYLQFHPVDKTTHNIWQEAVFAKFSKDKKIISGEIIDEDTKKLEEVGGKIKHFVNKGVAHLDKKGPTAAVHYDDLDKQLMIFDDIARKYFNLITGNYYLSLQPVITDNWKKIFTVPFDIKTNDTIPNSK